MKNIRKNLTLTFILLLVVFTINAQSKIDMNFSGIKKIDMNTASGNCIIKKGDSNQINVKLEHSFGDAYNPIVEQKGEKLVIKEKYKKGSWKGSARWTITIPDNLDIKFNTGSGDFEAADLDFTLSMNTGSGDLTLSNIKGEIYSNSGSGGLDLEGFSGDLKTNIGSGEIQISDVSGYVNLNCGSGSIKLSNINAEIDANVGSGDIKAKEIVLAGSSSFNSGSGDIVVDLSESPKHDISVNSGSGDAELDFNGNDIKGTVIMTANKRHGEIEAPFKFDTEEEINTKGSSDNVKIRKTVAFGSSDVQIKIGTGSGVAKVMK